MEQRLSLITLGVASVSESKRFYERLGWKASSVGGEEVAFFQIGGMVLGLYGNEDLSRDAGLPVGSYGSPRVALAYNVREKADVDAVLVEAERAGAQILKHGEEKFWGGYSGYFLDRDGSPWEVAWNPGFELKDDGSVILPE